MADVRLLPKDDDGNPNENLPNGFVVPAPQFAITPLGQMSVEALIRDRIFPRENWSICRVVQKTDDVWITINPEYKAVPDPNYLIQHYPSVEAWQNNHEADEQAYQAEYGSQIKRNRACRNSQYRWFVPVGDYVLDVVGPVDVIADPNADTEGASETNQASPAPTGRIPDMRTIKRIVVEDGAPL